MRSLIGEYRGTDLRSIIAMQQRRVWRTLVRRDVGQGSYSSPDFGVIHGHSQLLVANIDTIAGVHPATGDVLWQRVLDSYDQGCILAPTAYRGGVFTSTRASRTGFYPLTEQGGTFTISDGWKNKLTVYMSSPIIASDHAFVHLKNGHFACIDLSNGKIRWISNRPFGKYSSMIWQGDRILALTIEGQLLLLAASPDRFFSSTSGRSLATRPGDTWLWPAARSLSVRRTRSLPINGSEPA